MRLLLSVLLLVFALTPQVEARRRSSDPVAKARQYDAKAQAAFSKGRYRKARRLYEKARKYDRLPAYDLGIARCQEHLGETEKALEMYRHIAANSPNPFDADEARKYAAALERSRAAADEERSDKRDRRSARRSKRHRRRTRARR